MAYAYILSRAIHVAARMKIADHLIDGPRTVSQLAHALGAHEQTLHRFLRFLASYGIFHEQEQLTFVLTPLAQPLLSNHEDSLQAWLAGHEGDEMRWRAYGDMQHSIETGTSAFEHVFGISYFDHLAQDPQRAKGFDEGMHNISSKEHEQIMLAYNFAPYKTVVDVGGGKGSLLAAIMHHNQMVQGILYDLSHVMPVAEAYFADNNLSARVTCQAGSFFEAVPQGADLYILKRILHDWDDASSKTILTQCSNAMASGSRLLIIDAVVAEGNDRDIAKDVDMAMLVLLGGQERTEAEWHSLCLAAGLHVTSITKTESMLSIILVEKA